MDKSLNTIVAMEKGLWLMRSLNEWPSVQKMFPGVQVDPGGYQVPTLVTDTTEAKPKKLNIIEKAYTSLNVC